MLKFTENVVNLSTITSIAITGGTGTFGRAFVRYILENYPNITRIVIFARDEFKHFEMQNNEFFAKHAGHIRHFIVAPAGRRTKRVHLSSCALLA